ncbi:MAG: adenosylmethionine--8-amino-7-oxononanoate transaminase [Verrucomicrobiales bacterium]|nr:adenosylmethionine--8-amino-7-oxononanoate transaminase [Verrucomicrobiales bacterium]
MPADAPTSAELRNLDKKHLWHPFTQMQDWCAPDHDPLVITSGKGVWLTDSEGRRYIDGNSSIWTNIHGHGHPAIDAAIRQQLDEIAHCSGLGFTNPTAILLAQKLVQLFPPDTLSRVFFSDDGSTAIECACKMAIQYRQLDDHPERSHFIAFDQAYHGDTAGAASLGGIDTLHHRFSSFGFDTTHVASLEQLKQVPAEQLHQTTAVIIEPLIQGAAGMKLWPSGMLSDLAQWCKAHDIFLILDEVMTGFGRTGSMFACQQEDVTPDFIALAKGLTGGYLPLAATLTSEAIFEKFLGSAEDQKTFYYGHSYNANPLGCAAALANLQIFESEQTLHHLQEKITLLKELLAEHLADLPNIQAIRQCGFIAAIDLAPDGRSGAEICLAVREHGLLTRPINNTIVLMPPLCISPDELKTAVLALHKALIQNS